MVLWKLELDEEYYRIFDSKKMVAGYFDPDYGDIFSRKDSAELVEAMLKNHDPVGGGVVMVPLVKFHLFDTDLDTTLAYVDEQVVRARDHLQKWMGIIYEAGLQQNHSVRISHTDQDMLTISFPVSFARPVPLDAKPLQEALYGTLERLSGAGLL